MLPFQGFRLWARRAPLAERAGAGIAAVALVASLVWLLVPNTRSTVSTSVAGAAATGPSTGGGSASPGGAGGGGVSGSGASGGAAGAGAQQAATPQGGATGGSSAGSPQVTPGAAAAGGGSASAPGSQGGGGTGGQGSQTGQGSQSGGASQQQASGGCVSPPGSDQGVTANEIKVAVVLINVVGPAADAAFGVAPPSQQQAGFQYVVDSINASGGVACRKLVPTYFQANPVDQSSLEQTCLDITQMHPFFVFDTGSYSLYTDLINCFPQNQLPVMAGVYLPTRQFNQFYPYLFGQTNYEVIYKDTILGLAQRGWFSAGQGFRKLGFLYRDCAPEVPTEIEGWLKQAGVPSSDIVTYDLGCPGLFASPSDIEQAVLKFEQNGVTNVTLAEAEQDYPNFTNIAQQQGFHPKYGLSDNIIISQTYANNHPNYSNMVGALAVANDRWGAEKTPGWRLAPGTVRCNAIFAAHGEPPVYQYPDSQSGEYCDQLWTFQAAVDHAPALQRTAVAAGLQAVGQTLQYSFPFGPADYSAPHTTWGGQYWRTLQFVSSCSCWRLLDPTWRPSF